MYTINFTNTSEKQLSKLPKNIQDRVFKTLDRCRVRPHTHVKKLVDSPHYRLRIGDYRAIMKIQNDKLIIVVVEIRHRKNVYY